MLNVRTSLLEQFRLATETTWAKEEKVRDMILKGQVDGGEMSRAMSIGVSWHAALEGESPACIVKADTMPWWRYGAWWFRGPDVEKSREERGPGLCEVPGSKVMNVFGVDVRLRGKADHLHGLVIRDAKTKLDAVDPSFYAPSLQWKSYLYLHDCQIFQYDLYSMKEGKGKDGFFSLTDTVSVRFYPYSEMENDIRLWLSRLLEWAHLHRLTQYLESEYVEAAKVKASV